MEISKIYTSMGLMWQGKSSETLLTLRATATWAGTGKPENKQYIPDLGPDYKRDKELTG